MILSKTATCQYFEIWQPRWHDQTVLLDVKKVGTHNKIVFTKAPTMAGEYYISGRDVHMCKVGTNGKIAVYEVPLRFLEPLEIGEPIPRSAKQLSLIEEV